MNVFARIIMLSYFASFFQSLRHQKSSQIGTLVKRFCSLQRIERIISNRGIGSRTEVSKLLKQGRVSCNGKIVKSGSIRFHKYVDIRIDGNPILHTPLLAIYHKPVGILSSMGDPWSRPTLEVLNPLHPFLKSMHPVGRLDCDTSGLLLFSSDGQLTQRLLSPQSAVPRVYEAFVAGTVDFTVLKVKLEKGVSTTDGVFPANLMHSEVLSIEKSRECTNTYSAASKQSSSAEQTEEGEGGSTQEEFPIESASGLDRLCSKVKLSVTEGKYRMVRRILHNAGHSVLALHRVEYGKIQLGSLPVGQVRHCSIDEEAWAETVAC